VETVLKARTRIYQLAAVDVSRELEVALASAGGGSTLETIAAAIIRESDDLSIDDVRGYVGTLVDAQLLVSELTPSVTSGDALSRLISQLDRCALDLGIRKRLGRIQRLLSALTGSLPGTEHQLYDRLEAEIDELPIASTPGQRYQVDSRLDASALSLGQSAIPLCQYE
jgi:hypothetical protein